MLKNIKLLLFSFLFAVISQPLQAGGCWIYLSDKGPAAAAAQDARAWEDAPLYGPYLDLIVSQGFRIRAVSRWLNAVSVEATEGEAQALRLWGWVKHISPVETAGKARRLHSTPVYPQRLDTLRALGSAQMGLDAFREAGLTGKGVRIAVLDAGFRWADVHPAFDSLRKNGKIVATRDFFTGSANVYHHSDHGTQVLACMGGWLGNRPLGAATDAEYLLARVEHQRRENAVEEDYWVAALEWADSLGADIINSSVAFMRPRYDYNDMNGFTAPSSLAANTAAARGIVVVCAMGNEGARKWRFMGAPADAPTVLSVGGAMPMPILRIKFASFGPNSSGHPKPDVAAPALVVGPFKADRWREVAGTSFAAPLVAGFAACLLEKDPGLRGGNLFQAVRTSAHRYPFYDYELGYGVPNARIALQMPNTPTPDTLFRVNFHGDTVVVFLSEKRLEADPFAKDYGQPISVHLEKRPGLLRSAFTALLEADQEQLVFLLDPDAEGWLRIWMGGYLWETRIYTRGEAEH